MSKLPTSPMFKDLTGKTFGKLTVVCFMEVRNFKARWKCTCSCEKETTVFATTGNLNSGNTASCGCLNIEKIKLANTTHGRARSPEYNSWVAMWQRCTSSTSKNHDGYKSKRPPEVWRSFEVFFAELGPKPSPSHTLERIKNHLPYGPGNCRWATPWEQSRNKSNTLFANFNGVLLCLTDACEAAGLNYRTVAKRLRRLGSLEEASYGYLERNTSEDTVQI